MVQNRSLLPEVEVLSHKGDKTSICCIKLLQLVQNFYPCSNDENAPPPQHIAVLYLLFIWVWKSKRVWWLHIWGSRLQTVLGGPNRPKRVRFLANFTCQNKFWAGKQKIPHKNHFLGCKKGPFFCVFMNFWKWWPYTNWNFRKWWPQCNHHFRKFANCRLALSAHSVPIMFMNFRKRWLHTISGHQFQKFTTF